MRALKMRSIAASHRTLTTTSWKPSSERILLQLHEKFPKNSVSTIPVIRHSFKQTGKVKKLGKWVPRELTANQKMVILKYHLLLFSTAMNHFSTGMGCVVKRQPAMTSSVAEPRRSCKALPKAKLAPKKRSWLLFPGLPVWPTAAFSAPGKPSARQTDEMHCQPQWLQPAALATGKGPTLLHDDAQPHATRPTLQKLDDWVTKFCLIHHIHQASRQPTTTSSSISVTFPRENTSVTSRRQDMFSKGLSNPRTCTFVLQE